MCTMCLCPCLRVASFTIGTDFYLFIYVSFHLFYYGVYVCMCVCEWTVKEYEMKKSGQSKTAPGVWGMMTRKFILHFEHSVSEAEVVNNGSCPRQQHFIMMLLSSLAVLSQWCYVKYVLLLSIFVCVCISGSFSLKFSMACTYACAYIWCYAIYQYFLTSPIDKWLTQKEAHRGNQITLAMEKERVRFVLTQQQSTDYSLIRFTQVNWYLCH